MARLGERKPADEIKRNVSIVFSNRDIELLTDIQSHMVAVSRSDCLRRLMVEYAKTNNLGTINKQEAEKQFMVPGKMAQRYSIYFKGNEPTMLKAIMITLRIPVISECFRELVRRFIKEHNIDVDAISQIDKAELYVGLSEEQIKMLRKVDIGGRGYTYRSLIKYTGMMDDDLSLMLKKGYIRLWVNRRSPDFSKYYREV